MSIASDSAGRPLPPVETPSADKLRIYGDFAFLAFRSARHREMSVATLHRYLEPAVELGQFRVFRVDDVPRGAVTWAFLSDEAERKLIEGHALDPADWRSGANMWVTDILAPYRGTTAGMVRWLMVPGNLTETDFRYRRIEGANSTRRIVLIDFRNRHLARVYDTQSYLDRQSDG